MSYSLKITELMEKYRAFFADPDPGQILATICPYTFEIDYSCRGLQNKPLYTWGTKDIESYIDYEVKRLRFFIDYTKDLDNDYVPSLNAAFGVGANSAWLTGTDIEIGEETSWSHPYIRKWNDMDKLKAGCDTKWYRLLKRMVSRISGLSEGDYIPSTYAHFAPFDMANALRGNQIFYDIYDEPEKVHKLMDICADATILLEEELDRFIDQSTGGAAVAGMWFPGKALFLSEDNSDLCSADIYREFARPCTQKVLDRIGGAYIHHHAMGWHIHGEISSLNKLRLVEISWDPNCPRPIDHLPELYEATGGVPLMTRCTAADVYQRIDELRQGRIVLMLNVEDLDEGREVMRFIRKHSKI